MRLTASLYSVLFTNTVTYIITKEGRNVRTWGWKEGKQRNTHKKWILQPCHVRWLAAQILLFAQDILTKYAIARLRLICQACSLWLCSDFCVTPSFRQLRFLQS